MKEKNDGIFDEFEFMYRHKAILKEKEEQRLKKEQEEKEAAEAAAKAAAKAEEEKQAAEKRQIKIIKKKKTPDNAKRRPAGKQNAKKPRAAAKTPARTDRQTSDKKVHPKYAKPYKNDRAENRRRPAQEKRKKLDREYEKEQKLLRRESEKRTRAERTARIRTAATRIFVYLLIASAAAAVLFGISFGALKLIVGYHKKVSHKNIAYQVGLTADMQRVTYETLIRNGVVYVCGNDIVNLCGFTVTGTADEIKYISPDDGNDTVLFYTGTNRAVINKNEIKLQAPTSYDDGKLYIPLSFFSSYATGLVCEYEPETEKTRASVKVYKHITNEYEHKTSGAAAIYEPVSFRLKEPVVLAKIDESALADEIGEATYKVDVTEYQDAINPEKIYGYISVINATHKATGTIEYDDLVKTCIQADSVEEPVMLRRIAARALEAMFLEIRGVEDLTKFNVYGGYNTFESSKAKDPSVDESLLGLSVVVSFGGDDDGFEDSRTYRWFAANSYKYGFIIRYPKGKSDHTGVGFRPRILRYVGRYAATKMHNEGLCLEEFIEEYNLERVLEIKRTAE